MKYITRIFVGKSSAVLRSAGKTYSRESILFSPPLSRSFAVGIFFQLLHFTCILKIPSTAVWKQGNKREAHIRLVGSIDFFSPLKKKLAQDATHARSQTFFFLTWHSILIKVFWSTTSINFLKNTIKRADTACTMYVGVVWKKFETTSRKKREKMMFLR